MFGNPHTEFDCGGLLPAAADDASPIAPVPPAPQAGRSPDRTRGRHAGWWRLLSAAAASGTVPPIGLCLVRLRYPRHLRPPGTA